MNDRSPLGGHVLPLVPALALVTLVVGLPILDVVALSFTRVDPAGGMATRWAGLQPAARLWQDSRFFGALSNTAIFTGASVVLETLLGIGFALVLDRSFRGRGLVRSVMLVPWALPTAVMALAFSWIFNDSFGVANDLLRRTGLVAASIPWLSGPRTAMAAIVLADVWKTTPFVALIVLAGLQGIPESVLEAARVDGLGPWQRFRHVVFPLLLPSIAVASLFRAAQAWGAFDIVYVMTGGGPGGSTETVSLYAYQSFFRYLDFGYGAAIAAHGTLLVAALALVTAFSRRRRGLP
ncbi:MAG TPA: sugar ABC transporter permease [Thermoanaerobaculia bacterium]|jgi:multiple sugar transport system permease protein|nr:sugar ABC transporter permease [Thermoanaerobaculia bacterium]